MAKTDIGVHIRLTPADHRKLAIAAEKSGSTIAGEVRGLIAESLRWHDREQRIRADLREVFEQTALALVPLLLEKMQIESGKSLRAQAPKTQDQPRDYSMPISQTKQQPAMPRLPEKKLIALQTGAYGPYLTDEVRARARRLMEDNNVSNPGNWMSEEEAQLAILIANDREAGRHG